MDWAGLMRAGITGLGLRPDQFWRLTPAELALMLGRADAPRPMGRATLDDLIRTYPDPEKGPT